MADNKDDNRLKDLIDDILKDPGKVGDLSQEDITSLRKQANPYGIVIPATKSWINISITNLRDLYLRRLHMVSLAGYLFRTLEEYEFKASGDELKELSSISNLDKRNEKEEEFKREFARDKVGAERFLRRSFDYNPDKHIKISYTQNKEDPERLKRYDEYKRIMEVSRAEKVITLTDEEASKEIKNIILNTYQNVINIRTIISKLMTKTIDAELTKYYNSMNDIYKEMKPVVEVLSASDLKAALAIGLPVDVFYQWDRYLTNHYEDIREIVNILYSEKPDIEYAIQYMDHFESDETAREHRQRWENSIISSVTTIENGAWSLLGPFKKNRERVKNCHILSYSRVHNGNLHSRRTSQISKTPRIHRPAPCASRQDSVF